MPDLHTQIKKLEKVSLSDDDMRQWLDRNGINNIVMTYPELSKHDSLESVLFNEEGNERACVINFLTRQNYGHWICLFKNNQGVNFFDSYGIEPDGEMDWSIDDYFRKVSDEDYPHLSHLIYEFVGRGGYCYYNNYQLQAYTPKMATCGRHVLTRLYFGNFYADQYIELIKKAVAHNNFELTDPDQLVTYFTESR